MQGHRKHLREPGATKLKYTILKLKPEYREKLGALSKKYNRSLTNMMEWLIDSAHYTETCKLCKGTGQYPTRTDDKVERCFVCHGLGEVPVRPPM